MLCHAKQSVLLVSASLFLAVTTPAAMGQTLDCASYSLNNIVNTAGDTDGSYPNVVPGDRFTFTMTPVTATSASWRIVNDATGSPGSTLVPGGSVSSSLTYTVTAPAPSFPIGYYVDSINGTATITASCTHEAVAVPTQSQGGLAIMGLTLALATALTLRRRRN